MGVVYIYCVVCEGKTFFNTQHTIIKTCALLCFPCMRQANNGTQNNTRVYTCTYMHVHAHTKNKTRQQNTTHNNALLSCLLFEVMAYKDKKNNGITRNKSQ